MLPCELADNDDTNLSRRNVYSSACMKAVANAKACNGASMTAEANAKSL